MAIAIAMPQLRLHKSYCIRVLSFTTELLHRILIFAQYAGCFILWYGSITAAWAGLIPPGVTCWLTTGPWFLFYQENRLREAALNAKTSTEFWRRISMLAPVWMHLGFNAQVWVPMWGSVIFGGRVVSQHDIIGFCFCVGSVCLIAFGTALFNISWRTPWVLFLYALCTRVVEQGWVAFSSAVNFLPQAIVVGLLIVTIPIALTTLLEFCKMHPQRKTSTAALQGYKAMRWAMLSAFCNLGSALLIWNSWQLTH